MMDTLCLVDNGIMCLAFVLLSVLMPIATSPTVRMPQGFSEYDFHFSKYLKCVQVVASQTLRDIVRAIYSRKELRTRNGTMTIRHFNMRANVEPDYYDMEEFLDCNIMEENFDITFAYRILKEDHICGEFFKKFPKDCREAIKKIVDTRNKLCHRYGQVLNFEYDVSVLEETLKQIYKKVSRVLKVSFDENISIMENDLKAIKMAHIKDDSTANLQRDLKDFKESKMFRLLQYGFQELCDYYKELKTISPLSWIEESKESGRFNMAIFTPPKLHDRVGDIPIEDLLKVEKKGKIIPDVILIQGLAGSGKTSLCRYMIHNWCNKLSCINLIEDFDLVLLIEIRKMTSNNILKYLREELLRSTCQNFETWDILSLLLDLNLLFVVDGYDEKSEASEAVVKDLFKIFHNKRIILTTRPELFEDTTKICKSHNLQYLPVTLVGFDDSKQMEYSKKVFNGMNKSCESFLEYLNGRGRVLQEHLKLPLTIALLIVLWMDTPEIVNRITNATSLYYELFRLFQEKLGNRLITQLKFQGADELSLILPRLLRYLGQQAWYMLLKGYSCVLNPEVKGKIERECRKKGIDAIEFMSAFLICEVTHEKKQNGNDFHEYSFLHKTQMEYLAAEYLAQSMKNDGRTLHQIAEQVKVNNGDWRRYQEVLLYLTGNMANLNILETKENDILSLTERAGIDSSDYCYWWKLVSESKMNADIPDSPDKPIRYKSLVHPQLGKLISNMHLSGQENWTLSETNVSAGLRLISLVNPMQLAASGLVIKIPGDVDPYDLPDFADALNDVYEHWNCKTHKFKAKVVMHLWKHNDHDSKKTSEKFLEALNMWADLENFTGGLSEKANFSGFSKLKTVRCLVTKPEVCKSFIKLPRSVRSLRITMAFSPGMYSPEEFVDLNFNEDLELSFQHIKDEHLLWLTSIVHKMARIGLKCLHLKESEVTYKGVKDIVKSLNGILFHSLYVTAPPKRDEAEEHKLHQASHFRIEWEEN